MRLCSLRWVGQSVVSCGGAGISMCERVSHRRRARKVDSRVSGVPRVCVRVTVARCGCGRPGTAGGAVRLAHLAWSRAFPNPAGDEPERYISCRILLIMHEGDHDGGSVPAGNEPLKRANAQ